MTHREDDDDDFFESGNVRDDRPTMGDNSGLEPDEALEGLDLQDLMAEGRKLLLQDLVKLVKQGQASPQEKNTLRQMLKDNGMIAGDPHEGAGAAEAQRPKQDLPSYPDPEYR